MKTVKPFAATEFVPTKFDTAEDKAKFANHYARFVSAGCPKSLFSTLFYRRLRGTFGHIAHYDLHGFYTTWFEDAQARWRFLQHGLEHIPCGDPAWTFSDVERAIQCWLRGTAGEDVIERCRQALSFEVERVERAELVRLRAKYPQQEG